MIRLRGRVQGVSETQEALQDAVSILDEELSRTVRAEAFAVTRTAQQQYLTGPRPQRLGVVTNRLRGSLNEGAAGHILQVSSTFGRRYEVTVGTNVVYADSDSTRTTTSSVIHEKGGVIRPTKGQYLAIPTPFIKTPAGAVQDRYNRPLRQIPNTFFVRSRQGGLSLWESLPGRKRRRGEGLSVVARPIFWLVRQVRIPPRPFLSTALRDRTQAITEAFAASLRRVEQRITARLRGR